MLFKTKKVSPVMLRHYCSRNLIVLLGFIFFTQSCVAEELNVKVCSYLPQFTVLYKKLPEMNPIAAVQALWDYEKKYDNPAGCESDLILSLFEKFEKELFYIKSGTMKIPSELLYRCFEFDPVYTLCNGIIADDTAHYEMAGIPTLTVPEKRNIDIVTKLPGATLIAVYQTTVKRIFDQKSVLKLKNKSSTINLPKDFKGNILIAMYETSKGNWPYRKVIWFF